VYGDERGRSVGQENLGVKCEDEQGAHSFSLVSRRRSDSTTIDGDGGSATAFCSSCYMFRGHAMDTEVPTV